MISANLDRLEHRFLWCSCGFLRGVRVSTKSGHLLPTTLQDVRLKRNTGPIW